MRRLISLEEIMRWSAIIAIKERNQIAGRNLWILLIVTKWRWELGEEVIMDQEIIIMLRWVQIRLIELLWTKMSVVAKLFHLSNREFWRNIHKIIIQTSLLLDRRHQFLTLQFQGFKEFNFQKLRQVISCNLNSF